MTVLRRFLVVVALMFWQGGFTFYAAVVVPVGQDVLGRSEQARVTQRVTHFLNLSGACALAVLAWEEAVSADPAKLRRRLRWSCWIIAASMLVGLAWLHVRLDAYLADTEGPKRAFRALHRGYLWMSTVQWAAMVTYTVAMLSGWRGSDSHFQTGATASG